MNSPGFHAANLIEQIEHRLYLLLSYLTSGIMVRRNVLAVLAMISAIMLHRQEDQIMARNLAVVREQLNLTFLAELDTQIFVTCLLLQ